ncbi:MAG: acyltransferase [Solirubrobacteraceae bacterium]
MGARDIVRSWPRAVGYLHGPRLGSWMRKQWVLARHPHATVRFGPGVYLGPGFSLHIPDNGTFIVGAGTEFRRGFRAEVSGEGQVRIGTDCHFTYSVLIQCSTTIEIGDRCMFGQSTIVLDGQHRFRDLTRPMLEQGYDFHDIHIEDDATVTTKCSIMADIGTRAFIGANSVVTKPIPPYTVAVGAPARPIDYFGPPGLEPEALKSSDSSAPESASD